MLSLSAKSLNTQEKGVSVKNYKIYQFLFYHVVLPGDIVTNLRLRTTRCLPKLRDRSEKKNALRTPSLLHNVYSSVELTVGQLNLGLINLMHVATVWR